MKFVAFRGYSWHFRQPLKAASVNPAERVEEVRKPADLGPIGPQSTERTVISREETSLWELLRLQRKIVCVVLHIHKFKYQREKNK